MGEEMLMFAISTLLGLGCLVGAGWVFFNPETLDVDKIFSIIACLLLGLVFFAISAWMLFHTHLRELWKPEPAAAASEPQKAPAQKREKQEVPQEAGKTVS